jgi:hypothetical protein
MKPLPAFSVSLACMLASAGCLGSPGHSTGGPSVQAPRLKPTVVHGPDGQVLPESAYPGALPVLVERYVGANSAGEPTVGITARGAAVYPERGNLGETRIMVSSDNGTTWVDRTPTLGNLGSIGASPISADQFVYADPTTGRQFTIDLDLGCSNLSWTDDAGQSWITNPIACGIPVNDHQSLAAGPFLSPLVAGPLYPNVLYYCVNQVADTTCTHSLDGGLTWIAGQPPYPGAQQPPDGGQAIDGFCGGLAGHVQASWITGTVFLPKGQCGVAEVARSTDNGATWQRVVVDRVFGFDGHDGAIAVDHKGTVYYFFLDRNTLPRLAVSHDDGQTWSRPINVTRPGITTAKFPAITAGGDGHIAFLYVGGSPMHGAHYADRTNCPGANNPVNPPTCPYQYPSELENATWSAYVGFSLNADNPDPVFATTTANPPTDPLARGDCTGRCYTPAGEGMLDFLDIQTNPGNGQVYVSLVDLCNDKCASPTGTFRDPATDRGAVGIQVGGTLLGRFLGTV